jgi:hypothetical protein
MHGHATSVSALVANEAGQDVSGVELRASYPVFHRPVDYLESPARHGLIRTRPPRPVPSRRSDPIWAVEAAKYSIKAGGKHGLPLSVDGRGPRVKSQFETRVCIVHWCGDSRVVLSPDPLELYSTVRSETL